ncbi:hypothetical protein EZS27_007735 [termite gut metagenome]|uniref:Uncharacterized protein n=1 Tax=termite gut metagenome TaxID=433724 RepID=A0A5J4SH14_9ZZZZ
MQAMIYLPHNSYDPYKDFDYVDPVFEKDFLNIVKEDYNKYSPKLNTYYTSGNLYIDNSDRIHFKSTQKVKPAFITGVVNIHNIDERTGQILRDSNQSLEILFNYYRNDMDFPLYMRFENIHIYYEIETEFKKWVAEHYKVQNARISEQKRLKATPRKDFTVQIGNQHHIALENCLIIDTPNLNEYTLFVNKITFLKTR